MVFSAHDNFPVVLDGNSTSDRRGFTEIRTGYLMGHEAGIQSILMETSDVAQARDHAGWKTQLGACRSRWVPRPSASVWLTSFGPTSVGAQESLGIKWRFSFQDVVHRATDLVRDDRHGFSLSVSSHQSLL